VRLSKNKYLTLSQAAQLGKIPQIVLRSLVGEKTTPNLKVFWKGGIIRAVFQNSQL
jgi:hypothetical protein